MLSDVPEGWVSLPFKAVLKRSKKSINANQLKSIGTVAHYSLPAFDAGKQPVIESGSEIKSGKTLIPSNCLLFSKLNPRIPRVWRVLHKSEHPPVCSTEFWAFEPVDRSVDLDFVASYLGWQSFLNAPEIKPASSTNSHQRINGAAFDNYLLNLPPLTEQKRIAEVLSSVDKSIQATQRLIEQAERVKQGLMEELLTGGLGNEAIERGEVPEGWTIKQLSELAAVKGGKRMPKGAKFSETPTEYPYIRVVDFENGTISTENLRFVSEEHQKQIARYTISQDDLYISIAGTLGLVGLVPASLNGAQLTENAAKIVLNDRAVIKKEYLALFLQSSLGQNQIFVKKGVGGGVPKLALFRIGEILVAYPSAEKQVNIISKVSSLSDTRKSNEVKLKQLEKLKKGLMDDLLTGKVRTV
tara:strand:+ start:15832 stop:17070 length:1239 start_codon:yes stop_codon:yes gene_type:complete